jgi:general secretion pathway protein C
VETVLRKYLWVVDLVVIGICAVFSAYATATQIGAGMARSQSSAAVAAKRPLRVASVPPQTFTKEVEPILKRNVFCSTCPPILPVVGTGPEPPPPVPPLQKTNLPLKLLAIMFAPPPADPRWSMAIIRDNDTHTAGPYAVGAKIREATIDDIEEDRIYLDFGGGRREYLELVERAAPAAPSSPTVAAAPAPPTDPFTAELDRGIKKTGEHSYEVQRSTVDALLGNMSALARGARIVPETKDGKPAGFRLFSVKPDGPFAKIGLQNSDVISAINGIEMNSPDQALMVYTKLRSANHLSVAIERNGQKITKDYNIR